MMTWACPFLPRHMKATILPAVAQPSASHPLCSQSGASQTQLGLLSGASTRSVASCLASVSSPGCLLGSSLGHWLPGLHHASLRSKTCEGKRSSAFSTLLSALVHSSPTHSHRLTSTQY